MQLSILAPEPMSRTIDPLPAKCQCGAATGTFRFLGGNVVGLTCDGCGKRLAPDAVRLYPLRKACGCGAEVGARGFIAPLGPHQSLYCLSCGAWNWHVSRADLANLYQTTKGPSTMTSTTPHAPGVVKRARA